MSGHVAKVDHDFIRAWELCQLRNQPWAVPSRDRDPDDASLERDDSTLLPHIPRGTISKRRGVLEAICEDSERPPASPKCLLCGLPKSTGDLCRACVSTGACHAPFSRALIACKMAETRQPPEVVAPWSPEVTSSLRGRGSSLLITTREGHRSHPRESRSHKVCCMSRSQSSGDLRRMSVSPKVARRLQDPPFSEGGTNGSSLEIVPREERRDGSRNVVKSC